MKKAAELVFIPSPGIGHLVSTVEIAKLLVDRDDRLLITVLIMKLSFDSKVDAYAESLKASSLTDQRIQFVELPQADTNQEIKTNPIGFLAHVLQTQKPHVRQIVNSKFKSGSDHSPQLAGFVVDMFCTTMIDVANEFGVPAYVFFTSSAGFLGLMFGLQILRDDHNLDTTELKDSHTHELALPSFLNPVPAGVLPTVSLNKESVTFFLEHARRLREAKGIVVNTFMELESYAIHSFSDAAAARIPPVYPVGPILNLKGDDSHVGSGGGGHQNIITDWLDDQPQSSVVFLCFGSMGSFGEAQVVEIARALEQSGTRFLWSLRQPPPTGTIAFPKDHENLKEVLPEGFLERTAGIGQVIGWAPQVEILGHPAVGGFVSHCGWNSTLESLWFGVPIATWPLYAEQQFNAFELVKELKLAVEIKLDYRRDVMAENENQSLVSAEEIERGIRQVMEADSETRKKVKEMSQKSRKALMDGGSSHSSLGRLIHEVIKYSSESESS